MNSMSGMIAADIRNRIESGELAPGDRVSSTREISAEWKVAHGTAAKVLAQLRDEELVVAIRGSRTVVAGKPGVVAALENARERIITAAIEIADTVGLAAMSMRAIAERLEGAPMSLYHHVSGKQNLVLLMAEAVLHGNGPAGERHREWRMRLESSARVLCAVYRRHPWLAEIDFGQLLSLSAMAGHVETSLQVLVGQGLDVLCAFRQHVLFHGFVRGVAANLPGVDVGGAKTGLGAWLDRPWADETEAAKEHPLLFEAVGKFRELSFEGEIDEIFELGIRHFLGGVGALLGERP